MAWALVSRMSASMLLWRKHHLAGMVAEWSSQLVWCKNRPTPLLTERANISMSEYRGPWKLVTLAVGVSVLIVGAFYYRAPDWDVPISLIMACFAYLTAPWSLRVLLERR
jgi:hypothetical protein